MRASRGLKWENKMNKLKRSICLIFGNFFCCCCSSLQCPSYSKPNSPENYIIWELCSCGAVLSDSDKLSELYYFGNLKKYDGSRFGRQEEKEDMPLFYSYRISPLVLAQQWNEAFKISALFCKSVMATTIYCKQSTCQMDWSLKIQLNGYLVTCSS